MSEEVRAVRRKSSTTKSTLNALDYIIDMSLHGKINTALPVVVTGVEASGVSGPAGYVDVKPLVTQTDGYNNAIAPSVIYHIPFFRLQAGSAALVLEPVVGDVGLAIFAQRDCSVLSSGNKEPVQPGSFRTYDQADGFYVGGFLNLAPQTYIELRQDNEIHINAARVVVTGDVIASGISLVHHKHPGDSGGTTGEPIA